MPHDHPLLQQRRRPTDLTAIGCSSCGLPGGGTEHITWANVVMVRGVKYHDASLHQSSSPPLSTLGPVVGRVARQTACHVGANHKLASGESTLLPVGTPLRSIDDFSASFRVAAVWNGAVTVFERDRRAGDVGNLDYGYPTAQVSSIEILNANNDAVVRTVHDAKLVSQIMTLLRNARVGNVTDPATPNTCGIAFTFNQDPPVRLTYNSTKQTIENGTPVPESIAESLKALAC